MIRKINFRDILEQYKSKREYKNVGFNYKKKINSKKHSKMLISSSMIVFETQIMN